MSKKATTVEATPAPAAEPQDNLTKLREIAGKYNKYMNAQYQAEVSYVPDTKSKAAVVVRKWLELPEQLQYAMNLPGLPFGHITQVYGKKDSGKSSLLMQAISSAQAQGILPILILTEHKFDFERLTNYMGGDPNAMIVLEADDLETGFTYLEKILRDVRSGKLVLDTGEKDKDGKSVDTVIDVSNQPVFIFWDSIGGTLSRAELEGDVEDWSKDMGRGAQALKKMVKRSAQLLNKVKDRVGILFLNQVWTARTPTGIQYDKPAGGETVQHYYAIEIQLKRGQEIKMDFQGRSMGIGYSIEMRMVKNHVNHNRMRSDLIAVAEGLLDPDELDAFKKRYKKNLKD